MIKVYICPKCGWVREVSRRNKVECYKCGESCMVQSDIEYEDYILLNIDERKEYAENWMNKNGQRKE